MTLFQKYEKVPAILALLLVLIAVTACSGPIDQKLVTGGTLNQYRASLAGVDPAMTEHERKAFNWAVSDLDLERLNRLYPDATPRQVIRGEVARVKEDYPSRIAALKQEAARLVPVRDELAKVKAASTELRLEDGFFGMQPVIVATLENRASLPVSQLQWKASLYLDDDAEPAAQTVLNDDYRSNGGFKPGNTFTARFKVGFVKGDSRWTSLAVRNARKKRVVLQPILGSVRDFSDRLYLAGDPAHTIEVLEAGLKEASNYSDI